MTKWILNLLASTLFLFGHPCSGQTDSLYTIALKKADSSYDFKRWGDKDNPSDRSKFEEAKKLYTIASQIKPNEAYPTRRIKEIEKILYDFKTKPIYNKLVSKADSLFLAENLQTAKTLYLKADSLYSSEYTKEKVSAIYALTNLDKNSS